MNNLGETLKIHTF